MPPPNFDLHLNFSATPGISNARVAIVAIADFLQNLCDNPNLAKIFDNCVTPHFAAAIVGMDDIQVEDQPRVFKAMKEQVDVFKRQLDYCPGSAGGDLGPHFMNQMGAACHLLSMLAVLCSTISATRSAAPPKPPDPSTN